MTRTRISLTAALIAHILAWAATIFFLFGPVYRPTGATLIEVNGLSAALLIVIPVALTAITLNASLPGATRPRLMLILRWASFALLLLFCVAAPCPSASSTSPPLSQPSSPQFLVNQPI